jgi:transposase
MPTHSLDLRQRIVAAYQAGGTSIREVAKRFIAKRGEAIGN